MTRWGFVILMVVMTAAGALALRWSDLDRRPMHTDEAVNTILYKQMIDQGRFLYDPVDRHGPALFYLTWPICQFSGSDDFATSNETTYRIVPLIFCLAMIFLLLALRKPLGNTGVVTAAVLIACSPGMVYYSRYFIHEMVFTFTGLLAIAAGWHLWQRPARLRVALFAMAVAFMHTVKETSVIAWFAMAVAAGLVFALNRWSDRHRTEAQKDSLQTHNSAGPVDVPPLNWRGIGLACLPALLFWLAIYTSFFTYWRGPVDAVVAYFNYANRATGAQGHEAPVYQYLNVMTGFFMDDNANWKMLGKLPWNLPGSYRGEWLIGLLAAFGFIAALTGIRNNKSATEFARWTAFYSITILAAYSLIPYKTPWNVLPILLGFILMAGCGVRWILDVSRYCMLQAIVVLVLAACSVYFAASSQVLTSRYGETHHHNPYVYAHTSPSILKLMHRIEQIRAHHPAGYSMPIQVIADPARTWPLPWYLRAYDNLDMFNTPDAMRLFENIPFAVVQQELAEQARKILPEEKYHVENYGLRRNVMLTIFIRHDLWEAMLGNEQMSLAHR